MQQSKLIESFRKLSAKQLSRFEEFLLSPYFNKNEENILFFKYLKKYAPTFEHRNLSKKTVLQKLSTSKKLDEKSLAYLMTRLTKLLDEFLAIEFLKSDEAGPPLHLMEQYHALGLPRQEKSAEAAVEKWLKKLPFRNARFYQQQFLFRRLQYENSAPNQRRFNEKLQEATDALDTYYVIEKLRYACEMLNFSSSLDLDYQIDFAEQVAGWANNEKFEEEPAVQIYQGLFLLMKGSADQNYFDKVKTLLNEYATIFTNKELEQLYTLLLNYCARRINQFNEEKHWREYLEINKALLANGIIFEKGQLSPWRYTNLVAVGLRIGQIEWTQQFIYDYKNKLPEDYSENLFHYSLAQFYFHQKDFDKAQRELIRVEFADVLLNISARGLLIKIYFETGQTELLMPYLEATRIFLLRDKSLDVHPKNQIKKFVEICTKIVKAELDIDRLKMLLKNLPPAQKVLHRDWLEEKLKEWIMGK